MIVSGIVGKHCGYIRNITEFELNIRLLENY